MIALIPPGLLLGVLLSAGYAALFHLWRGRGFRDLGLFLLAAGTGFAVGHVLADLAGSPVPPIGRVQAIEASILAWVSLIAVRELTHVE
jgi:hypothetical protein